MHDAISSHVPGVCRDAMVAKFVKDAEDRGFINVIGKIILSVGNMCIVPWVEWSPSNHLYVTHKGLQLVVKEALLLLIRKGIHRDIALSIAGMVMAAMKERQLILSGYAWDDTLVAYREYVRRIHGSQLRHRSL
jgi:hypothetical protein